MSATLDFFRNFVTHLRRCFDFKGPEDRTGFWYHMILSMIIWAVAVVLLLVYGNLVIHLIFLVFAFFLLMSVVAATVRRARISVLEQDSKLSASDIGDKISGLAVDVKQASVTLDEDKQSSESQSHTPNVKR